MDALVITLVSFVIFNLFIGSYNLIAPDEGRYVEIAREMIASGNYITPQLNGTTFLDKPILFYWIETIIIKIFGLHEWSVRLLPVTFGAIGCLLNYWAGLKLFSRRTGLLSAFLLMSTLIYFFSAHYTNMDLMVAVLISGSLYFAIIGLKGTQTVKQRTLYLWGAYLFAALAFLTKGLIGIVFPILVIGAWVAIQREWRIILRLRIITGFIIFLALTAPWMIAISYRNPEFLHYFFVVQQFSRYTSGNFNVHQPFYFYIVVILLGLIPWVIFLFQSLHYQIKHARQFHDAQHSSRLYLLLWPLIVLIFFSIPASKIIGYILPAIPPLILLIANYLHEHSAHLVQSKTLKIGTSVFLALSAIVSFTLIIIAYMPNLTDDSAVLWLTIIATIIMLGGVRTVYCAFYKEHLLPTIATLCFTVIVAFIICVASVATFKINTVKPLAQIINKYQTKNDLIVTYRDYFQDLPAYVRHRVFVVYEWSNVSKHSSDGWRRELAEDILFKHYRQHNLITPEQFIDLWKHKNMFVVLKKTKFGRMKSKVTQTNRSYHIIEESQSHMLVTNFPLKNHKQGLAKTQASIE